MSYFSLFHPSTVDLAANEIVDESVMVRQELKDNPSAAWWSVQLGTLQVLGCRGAPKSAWWQHMCGVLRGGAANLGSLCKALPVPTDGTTILWGKVEDRPKHATMFFGLTLNTAACTGKVPAGPLIFVPKCLTGNPIYFMPILFSTQVSGFVDPCALITTVKFFSSCVLGTSSGTLVNNNIHSPKNHRR